MIYSGQRAGLKIEFLPRQIILKEISYSSALIRSFIHSFIHSGYFYDVKISDDFFSHWLKF